MLTTILILFMVAFLVIKFLRNRYFGTVRYNRMTYTWPAILWPFNLEPFSMYKHLSAEHKTHFWSVATNTVVAILTCWLGFSVQYLVYSSSVNESERLAHYEVVEKFLPLYDEYSNTCANVLDSIYFITSLYGEKDIALNKTLKYLSNDSNWNDIITAAELSLPLMGAAKYYFSDNQVSTIDKNNMSIAVGIECFRYACAKDLPDSVTVVKQIIQKLSSTKMNKYVGHNSSLNLSYSLIKLLHDEYDNPTAFRVGVAGFISQAIIIPLIQNLTIFSNEITPKSPPINIGIASLLILFGSIFLGYMIFRIIIMRSFTKEALEPNPMLSKTEFDKMKKKQSIEKSELEQRFKIACLELQELKNENEKLRENNIFNYSHDVSPMSRVLLRYRQNEIAQQELIDELSRQIVDLEHNIEVLNLEKTSETETHPDEQDDDSKNNNEPHVDENIKVE